MEDKLHDMDLKTKKKLAARVLGVGTGKVLFEESRLSEIKDVLTRQDIRDLIKSGAIKQKESGGRRKVEKRKTKRRAGKIKKKINLRKRNYALLSRKLRKTLAGLKKAGVIKPEQYIKLRKDVKAKIFRSRAHLMGAIKK